MLPKVSSSEESDGDIDFVTKGLAYTWYSMDFYTYWTVTGQCWVLCSETPEGFPQSLIQDLDDMEEPLELRDPLVMHRFLLDRMVHLLDICVRRVRDQARHLTVSGPILNMWFLKHVFHLNIC